MGIEVRRLANRKMASFLHVRDTCKEIEFVAFDNQGSSSFKSMTSLSSGDSKSAQTLIGERSAAQDQSICTFSSSPVGWCDCLAQRLAAYGLSAWGVRLAGNYVFI
jgi:hypothetical protein